MTTFHGFCSYPHGGWVLVGLLLSCIAALSSIISGMASCQFLRLDFESDRGCFEEVFLDPTPDGEFVACRGGAGLYTWLQPFDDTDWSEGICLGYTELQRLSFSDTIFEASRVFGVLSVLGGVGMTLWVFFLSCLSLRRLQIWAMRLGFFLLTCFASFTFLIFQSQLCNDLLSFNDESDDVNCTIDQGGLVTIAGAIFWCVALAISVVYVKPQDEGRYFSNRSDRRQTSRSPKTLPKKDSSKKAKAFWNGPSKARDNQNSSEVSTPPSVRCYDDGVELQLSSHRGI